MLELWPEQIGIMDQLRASLRAGHKSPLVVSPTGSGKSILMAWLSKQLISNRKRVIILVHRAELLDQLDKSLDMMGVPHDLIQAGSGYYNPFMGVHVASVFTLVRRLPKTQVPDVILADESHHAIGGSTWGKIIEYWKHYNPKLITIGFTATPQRLSGEGLGQMFDDMILGPDTAKLIELGVLSKYIMYAPAQQLDTSQLHHRVGDFVRSEVDELVDKPKITGSAINHYRKYLNGAPTLVFCNSIKHTENVADEFRAAGFRAASLDGKMKADIRREIVADFSQANLNILTSCELLNEGFDCPGAVGCINLRPTESLALAIQQWGRVLRTAPGKERAIILDHVGNSARHGLPDSPREWSLEGSGGRKAKRDPDDIQIRQCPACGCINTLAAQSCKDCGEKFIVKERTIEEVDGELEEVDPKIISLQFRRDRFASKDLESLTEVGRLRGMKHPKKWAQHVLDARATKKFKIEGRYG